MRAYCVTVLESVKIFRHNLRGCRLPCCYKRPCCHRLLKAPRGRSVKLAVASLCVPVLQPCMISNVPSMVTLCSCMIRNGRPGAVVCPQTECKGSDCSRAVACQTVWVPHECLGEDGISDYSQPLEVQTHLFARHPARIAARHRARRPSGRLRVLGS